MRTAWSANNATATSRSTGSGGLDADRMRGVWVERRDSDPHLPHRGAKCDRSETAGRLPCGGLGPWLKPVEDGRGLFDDRAGYVTRERVPDDVSLAFRDYCAKLAELSEMLARCRAVAAYDVG